MSALLAKGNQIVAGFGDPRLTAATSVEPVVGRSGNLFRRTVGPDRADVAGRPDHPRRLARNDLVVNQEIGSVLPLVGDFQDFAVGSPGSGRA